jgi:hypothetical protein
MNELLLAEIGEALRTLYAQNYQTNQLLECLAKELKRANDSAEKSNS